MKNYNEPIVEVMNVYAQDVIRTSGELELSVPKTGVIVEGSFNSYEW